MIVNLVAEGWKETLLRLIIVSVGLSLVAIELGFGWFGLCLIYIVKA